MSNDSRLSTICRKCGATIEYPAKFAGRRAGCKSCGNSLELPVDPFDRTITDAAETEWPILIPEPEEPLLVLEPEEVEFVPATPKAAQHNSRSDSTRPCKNCHQEIVRTANRCSKCGEYVPFPAADRTNAFAAVGVVMFLICCGICTGVASPNRNSLGESIDNVRSAGHTDGQRAGDAAGFQIGFNNAKQAAYDKTLSDLDSSYDVYRPASYCLAVMFGAFIFGYAVQYCGLYAARAFGFLADIDSIVLPQGESDKMRYLLEHTLRHSVREQATSHHSDAQE